MIDRSGAARDIGPDAKLLPHLPCGKMPAGLFPPLGPQIRPREAFRTRCFFLFRPASPAATCTQRI